MPMKLTYLGKIGCYFSNPDFSRSDKQLSFRLVMWNFSMNDSILILVWSLAPCLFHLTLHVPLAAQTPGLLPLVCFVHIPAMIYAVLFFFLAASCSAFFYFFPPLLI